MVPSKNSQRSPKKWYWWIPRKEKEMMVKNLVTKENEKMVENYGNDTNDCLREYEKKYIS